MRALRRQGATGTYAFRLPLRVPQILIGRGLCLEFNQRSRVRFLNLTLIRTNVWYFLMAALKRRKLFVFKKLLSAAMNLSQLFHLPRLSQRCSVIGKCDSWPKNILHTDLKNIKAMEQRSI